MSLMIGQSHRPARQKRLLIFGTFGTGDIPSDWSLSVLLDHLRCEADVSITVACQNPETIATRYTVQTTASENLYAIEAALRQSDLVIWLGGDIPDISPSRIVPCADLLNGCSSLDLAIAHLTCIYRKPLVIADLTLRLSPLGLKSYPLLVSILQHAQLVTVRDAVSLQTCKECLANAIALRRGDLRFLASQNQKDDAKQTAQRLLVLWKDCGLSPDHLGQALHNWLTQQSSDAGVEIGILDAHDIDELALASLWSTFDEGIAKVEFLGHIDSLHTFNAAIQRATQVLAMQATGVIAAWKQHKPAVAIMTDNETRCLFAQAGIQDGSLSCNEAVPESLSRLLNSSLDRHRPSIDTLVEKETSHAHACVTILMQYLRNWEISFNEPTEEDKLNAKLWYAVPTHTETLRMHQAIREAQWQAREMEKQLQTTEQELANLRRAFTALHKHRADLERQINTMLTTRAWQWGRRLAAMQASILKLLRLGKRN